MPPLWGSHSPDPAHNDPVQMMILGDGLSVPFEWPLWSQSTAQRVRKNTHVTDAHPC